MWEKLAVAGLTLSLCLAAGCDERVTRLQPRVTAAPIDAPPAAHAADPEPDVPEPRENARSTEPTLVARDAL